MDQIKETYREKLTTTSNLALIMGTEICLEDPLKIIKRYGAFTQPEIKVISKKKRR